MVYLKDIQIELELVGVGYRAEVKGQYLTYHLDILTILFAVTC